MRHDGAPEATHDAPHKTFSADMNPHARRRRSLMLAIAAACAGGAGLGAWWRRDAAPADALPASAHGHGTGAAAAPSALRRPGRSGLLADLRPAGPVRLQAAVVQAEVFAGAATTLWAYQGCDGGKPCLNPTLHVSTGDTLDVTLHNALAEDTTVHWHGLMVDEANDGSGLHPVPANGERRYRFEVRNRAGLYWYHAHPHHRTGRQLQMGLAGLLLVEDDEERALRVQLGLPWGERDLPLMLTDKQVDARNAIVYRDEADDWIGNRVLANWSPEPAMTVAPGLHRFRMINVANARVLRPAFLHEGAPLPVRLIGTDGGLLDQPRIVDDLFLAPAQRADVLVDFGAVPAGARVVLRSLDYVAMENEDESGPLAPDIMADHPGAVMMGDALDLMVFDVEGIAAPPIHVPDTLSSLPPPPDTTGWKAREIRLSMGADGEWLINGLNFRSHGHHPAFEVKRGSREVWDIRNNMTSMPHPIHIHGVQFRVVSRSISPPDIRARQVADGGLGPQDLGFNDTVLVWPGEIVRVAIDFSQPFSGTQRYMLHCHNLEHEDMGMMLTFAVVD